MLRGCQLKQQAKDKELGKEEKISVRQEKCHLYIGEKPKETAYKEKEKQEMLKR